MLTFCGQRRPPITSMSLPQTRSSCGTARSWLSHSLARSCPGTENSFIQHHWKTNATSNGLHKSKRCIADFSITFVARRKIMTTRLNETIERLKTHIKGHVVLLDDPNYDEVREIWNAMIDRKPAVIVQCAKADDVSHAIAFARENKLDISIRGGGHNIAGNAVCDHGVMIDLSTMTNVRIDAQKRRAYVEPGTTLADFDQAAQVHGLATPVGINSTTGIAGLTLGGGFGWLTRKYGMT